MDPEGSSPCSKESTTDPYREPFQSSSYSQDLQIHLNVILQSTHMFPSCLCPLDFPTKISVPLLSPYACYMPLAHLILHI